MGMKDAYVPLCDAMLIDAETRRLIQSLRVEVTGATFRSKSGNPYRKVRAFDVSSSDAIPIWGAAYPGKDNPGADISGALTVTIYTTGNKTTFDYLGEPRSQITVPVSPQAREAPHRSEQPEERASGAQGGSRNPGTGWDDLFGQAVKSFLAGAQKPQSDRLWTAVESIIRAQVATEHDASRVRKAMAILFHPDGGSHQNGDILARANALIEQLAPKRKIA